MTPDTPSPSPAPLPRTVRTASGRTVSVPPPGGDHGRARALGSSSGGRRLGDARTALRARRGPTMVLPVGQQIWRDVVSVIVFFAVLLAAYFLMAIITAFATRDWNAVMITVKVAVVVVTLVWCWRHRKVVVPALARFGTVWDYVLAIVGAAAVLMVNTLLLQFELTTIGLPSGGDALGEYAHTAAPWMAVPLFVILLDMAVYPGVVEELGFRGVIQPTLGKIMSAREAVFATGIVFAFVHLSALSLPALFLAGLWLGYLRVRSGSLYPGILAHFLNNGLIAVQEWYRFSFV